MTVTERNSQRRETSRLEARVTVLRAYRQNLLLINMTSIYSRVFPEQIEFVGQLS